MMCPLAPLPLPLLKGMRTLRREVKAAQTVLGRFGIVPLARLIGKAGTGIFTLAIARKCREVVAIDISSGMLERSQRKAEKARLDTIKTKVGNAETLDLGGTYSLADLPVFFQTPRTSSRAGRQPLLHNQTPLPVPLIHSDRQRRAEIEAMLAGALRTNLQAGIIKNSLSAGGQSA